MPPILPFIVQPLVHHFHNLNEVISSRLISIVSQLSFADFSTHWLYVNWAISFIWVPEGPQGSLDVASRTFVWRRSALTLSKKSITISWLECRYIPLYSSSPPSVLRKVSLLRESREGGHGSHLLDRYWESASHRRILMRKTYKCCNELAMMWLRYAAAEEYRSLRWSKRQSWCCCWDRWMARLLNSVWRQRERWLTQLVFYIAT